MTTTHVRDGDPNWFFKVTFTDGATMTFYADNLALAVDHATTVARDVGKTVAEVTRLTHKKHLTPTEVADAGTIFG